MHHFWRAGFPSHSLTSRGVVHFSPYIALDDAHSRGVLGEYVCGSAPGDERRLVYSEDPGGEGSESGVSALGDLLKKALAQKDGKNR
jgi:hypothetical protein